MPSSLTPSQNRAPPRRTALRSIRPRPPHRHAVDDPSRGRRTGGDSRRADGSVEAQLALLLAGTAARRRATEGRLVELARAADEPRLLEVLTRQRLLLLGAERLARHAPGSRSRAFAARVRASRAQLAGRGFAFRAATGFVTQSLEAAGIPALPLKGASLAERVHGDPALRTYGDLDVLVPPDRLWEAVRVCQGLGYRRALAAGDGQLPELHVVLLHASGAMPPLELHWRVHWYERAFAADMLSRSWVDDGGERIAAPADELAALLLFHARDGFVGLRLPADVGAWWDRFGAEVEAGALGALCRRYPDLASALRVSASVSDRLVGLPADRLLGDGWRGPNRRRERIAGRLANWPMTGDPDQISADVTLVDGLCAPPGQRAAFLRRYLVPDVARIRDYYDLPEDARWRRRVWSVLHPPKVLLRYGLALRAQRGAGS